MLYGHLKSLTYVYSKILNSEQFMVLSYFFESNEVHLEANEH